MNESLIYGSFYLSESEFAIEGNCLQEVVSAPPSYTSIPLGPSYLKGLFNLRGTVIPVLDLRNLLKLEECLHPNSQKIAIVEREGNCIGLLFDQTGEVFRSNDEELCRFDSNHSSGVVAGVFKKNDGKRIIQILDVTRLFKLDQVPKDAGRNRLERESLGRKRGARKKCISFAVGPAKCALAIEGIQEILKVPHIEESAIAGDHCMGMIDLRGTLVPVVNFVALLKYPESDLAKGENSGMRRIIVLKLDVQLIGLMVDSVDSIISYFPDELISFPLIEQNRSEMFVGCITSQGDSDTLLLDYQKILSSSEISEITHGHNKLYKNAEQDNEDAKLKRGTSRTFITFQIGADYAVDIRDIKEIIEYPEQLLTPPGLKAYVRGVLKLRGDLVTIIDPRTLYAFQSAEPNTQAHLQRVLVFNKNGVHLGLVVDSVESIVTFAEIEKVKLPEMFYSKSAGGMSEDVFEAVELTQADGTKKGLLILSSDALAARASKPEAA